MSEQPAETRVDEKLTLWGPAVRIERPLADIIVRYAASSRGMPSLALPSIASIEGLASVRGIVSEANGYLEVELEGRQTHLYRWPQIRIELTDSSVIESTSPRRVSHGKSLRKEDSESNRYFYRETTTLKLDSWCWRSAKVPVAWVGLLRGVSLKHHNANLGVECEGYSSFTSIRLQGNATWHLLRSDADSEDEYCIVVVDKKAACDLQLIADDFMALEFLFGVPLRLELLVGVDSNHESVAAIGTDLGYRFHPRMKGHPPVPFSEMGGSDWPERKDWNGHDPNWMAVAFPRLVRAIAADDLTPTSAAISAYVSSTMGYIDEQYLMAQVGLEALASRILEDDDKKPIIKDWEKWKAWLETVSTCIESHAIDKDAFETLKHKLESCGYPTTGRIVERILARMGVNAPQEALREIRHRGSVAHSLSMNRDKAYDADRDARRTRIIRALLASLLLRHVGYHGMVQGWELNDARWVTPAEWCSASTEALEEAQVIFEACTSGPHAI
jgi:hypothetical protein